MPIEDRPAAYASTAPTFPRRAAGAAKDNIWTRLKTPDDPLSSSIGRTSKSLSFLLFLYDISTPTWVALSGAISGFGGWFVSVRKINASIERARIKMIAEAATGEAAERASFRESLMAEMAALRQLIRECETERDVLRARINTAEGQILVLKASNEIMERWVTFFKDRNTPEARAVSKAVKHLALPDQKIE
jgi:hypothetical protein